MKKVTSIYADGSGPSRILSPETRGYVSALFSQGKYPLDAELNLMQFIQADARAAAMRAAIPSGFAQMGQIIARQQLTDNLFNNTTYGTYFYNTFFMGPSVVYINGYKIDLQGAETASLIPVANAVKCNLPTVAGNITNISLVYLEAWFQEIGPTGGLQEGTGQRLATIAPYGKQLGLVHGTFNTTGSALSTDEAPFTPLTNDLKDAQLGVETTGRVQLCWRIRSALSVGLGDFLSGTGSNVIKEGMGALNLYPYANSPSGFVTSMSFKQATAANNPSWGALYADDPGLYVAGSGSNADAKALGTVDGFVYALPLFAVKRRTLSGFSVAQPDGGILANSGLSYKDATGTTQTLTTAATVRISDRPDGRFNDIVEYDDIIDLRHQVFPGGVNKDRLLQQTMTLLGTGQLATRDIQTIAESTRDSHNYARHIMNYLQMDQLQCGATASATQYSTNAGLTDGAYMYLGAGGTAGSGYALANPDNSGSGATLPFRRYWGDAAFTQTVALRVNCTPVGAGTVILSIYGGGFPILPGATGGNAWRGTDNGTGIVFDTGAVQVLTTAGAAVAGVTATGGGTVNLTLTFGAAPPASFIVVAPIKYFGHVGSLSAQPLNSVNGLAGSGNPYSPLLAAKNFNGGDPYGDWFYSPTQQDPNGNYDYTLLNPLVGWRYGPNETMNGGYQWRGGAPWGSPAEATIGFTAGSGQTSLTIGPSGIGSSGGAATAFGRKVLFATNLARVGVGDVTITAQSMDGNGTITLTFGALATGQQYVVSCILDASVLAVHAPSRAVQDITRTVVTAPQTGGVGQTVFTFTLPGPAIAPTKYYNGGGNAWAWVQTGGVGNYVLTTVTATINGPFVTVTFGASQNTNNVKIVGIYSYTPVQADQIVLFYRALPYQGRAPDFYGGGTDTSFANNTNNIVGPLSQVYYAPRRGYLTSLGTGFASPYFPWRSGALGNSIPASAPTNGGQAGANTALISTIFLPMGYGYGDHSLIGDAVDVSTSANWYSYSDAHYQRGQPHISVEIGPPSVACNEFYEGLTFYPNTQSTSSPANTPLRGWLGASIDGSTGNSNSFYWKLPRSVLMSSRGYAYWPFLVAVGPRIMLAVASQVMESNAVRDGFGLLDNGYSALEFYECPGRPIVRAHAL